MAKPLIGLGLDYEAEGSFSPYPYYALREHYFHAILAAGGIPLAIPHTADALPDFLDQVQGVLAPGGVYPSPNDWYGEANDDTPLHPRAAFDCSLMRATLERDLPVLGICAGMQVMAYTQGSVCYHNVHQETDTTVNHKEKLKLKERVHSVTIDPDSQLYQLIGTTELQVNSNHNEAIKQPGTGVNVSATAPDGVIEAIELPAYRFAVGVQWHPEFFAEEDSPDQRIFKGFIQACQNVSPNA